ncbi:MAG: hypothetical protein A2520_01815 [Deltaproteobacteria bacterium RIFOXYD12_FULL_53_23]|nr:MAG: hypothetical protein A2520_01815 [Deltaproteobacteria bacterium RIFOXYD12_FULL_53_23]
MKTSSPLPIIQASVLFWLMIRICAAFVAITGSIALLGWILSLPFLSSFGSGTIPVAPSTAILFILYAVVLYLHSGPPHRNAYWAGLIIPSAGAVVALVLFILSSRGIYLEAEHLGIAIMHPARAIPIGHMSPVTALCFLFASLAFLSISTKHPKLATLAGLLAGLLAVGNFVFVLAYVFGAPLLYDSAYIPPAALTSTAFIFLGSALFVLALSPVWLARLRTESSPSIVIRITLLFACLAIGIIVVGLSIYRNYERDHRREMENQLSTIAELKVNQLREYRRERLGDGAILLGNTSFANLVRRHLQHPEDTANSQELEEWLNKLRTRYQYNQVRLIDTLGITRLSNPAGIAPVTAVIAQRLPEVLKSGQVTIQDFYRHDYNGRIYLAILVPILDPQNSNRPLAMLSLRIDPQRYLYPFLQSWPIPSRTGETLLVRREGQEVVFLNELKFQQDTALALHFPLNQTDLPATQAVLDRTGIFAGKDYRGKSVYADLRPIPDSPWFLVSKMDTSEVYAPLQEHLWLISGFIAVLLFGVGAIMAFVWQRQRVAFFRERLGSATALKNLNRVYAMLSNINQTIVRVREPKKLFQEACRIAVEDGGFRLAWIGLLDKNSGAINSAASAGMDEGYIAGLNIILGNLPSDQGPTGAACQEGRHSIANDIEHEPNMAPWREQALARGYRSSAAFPLIISGTVRGCLNLYADTVNFFNDQEIKLLDELASDIAFSLEFSEQEENRRKAEADLRESQQLFATVANTSPALIWMSDLNKQLIWFNDPWLAFTGRTLAEEQGNGWTAGVHPDNLAHCLQNFSEAFDARLPFSREYRLRRYDGEYRWLFAQAQPRYDASGVFAGYISSSLDISAHRQLENQIRHAVKMESIGTLAGGVAHDFNNILTAIIGYGQIALMSMPQDDPQRLNILPMLEAADRAARLTKDLLLFSRKQISERKTVDLNDIVKTVEKFIVRVIGADIVCETRIADQPLIVFADSHQMEQVLMNFATNARDAMPKGGIFSITTEETILNQEFIESHGFGRPGKYALLTATDSGSGMDGPTLTRIFDPFFTTKGVGKGTGLGLSVAYGIIKEHEGYINVYSEPGHGTTFRLYLPLTGAEIKAEINTAPEGAPIHGTETILLADDDEALRNIAITTLNRFGYTVIEAVDGEEAVRKFTENQADIQLLLFDIIMPKMNGQEAYEAISKIQPGIKTIFMSGYVPDIIRAQVDLEKSATLLTKPLAPAELLRKIREVLDK